MRLDVRNYFLSFRAVIRLQVFWLLIIILGLILVGIFSVILICYLTSTIVQILIFFSGALVGFGSSAFFSRPQQFLLRGSGDAVYLIENNFWYPHAHKLANSITVDVFGGVWHEIEHVSERMLKTLEFFFGKEELDISKATLCQVGNSIFAVLKDTRYGDTRYGIPDPETLREIWPGKSADVMSVNELDKFRPGRDLVSICYWHRGKYKGTKQTPNKSIQRMFTRGQKQATCKHH